MTLNLIVRLIAKYALWIYIICGAIMLFYLNAALQARRFGSQTIFHLEREQAARQVYRASGMIMVLLTIVVGVYAISHYTVLPAPSFSPLPTPTPTVALTPTPTRRPLKTPTPATVTPTPRPTPTRRPRRTVVVLPTLVPDTPTPQGQAAPPQCPHPNVQVSQPGINQVINAGVEVKGTANKKNFDRYEFKFKSLDFDDEWHWVQTFRTPVENGSLGVWQTAHLPPGRYMFMVIAIDRAGNSDECVVPVVIKH